MSATQQGDHEIASSHHASHINDHHNQPCTLTPDSHPENSAPRQTSLFSAGLPAPSADPKEPSSEHPTQDIPAHARTDSSDNPPRPLATFAALPSMKRSQRMRPHEDPPPIVQFSTQIPSAQKAQDDPTTPPDSKPARESRRGREYTTLTTLSRLFAGNDTMPSSRAPSYNQATGPLYMRGTYHEYPGCYHRC